MNQWVSDLQQLTQMIKPSSPIKEQNEDDRQGYNNSTQVILRDAWSLSFDSDKKVR